MTPDIKWLDDPTVFRVGQKPAHSDHQAYRNNDEMAMGQSATSKV